MTRRVPFATWRESVRPDRADRTARRDLASGWDTELREWRTRADMAHTIIRERSTVQGTRWIPVVPLGPTEGY